MYARLEAGKPVKYNKIPNTIGNILNAPALSDDKLADLGFLPVFMPDYDSNTQQLHNLHKDGDAFTYDVKERDFGMTIEDAKLYKLEELRRNTHSLLSETDWYITRKTELDIDIPQSVLDMRQEIRDNHNIKDEAIFALDSILDVINYSI